MAKVSRWLRSKSGMGAKPYFCNSYTGVGIGKVDNKPYGIWIDLWRHVETGQVRQTVFLDKDEMMILYRELQRVMESK